MYTNILDAIQIVFSVSNFIAICAGIFLGTTLAAMPGLTANIGIALLVPFTFYMEPITGIVMLMAMAKGGTFGGAIPAVLLNLPGTPAAAITAIDGYPLSKKGYSLKALQAALFGSCCGDLFSDIVLLFAAAPLAMVALMIGPVEFAMILFFALTIIASVAGKSPIKGLMVALLGLMLSFIGRDPLVASERFTFSLLYLSDGISLIPLLIGMLVLSEVITQLEEIDPKILDLEQRKRLFNYKKEKGITWKELKGCIRDLFVSSIIGTIVGIIPGIGATVAGYLGYNEAKNRSKNPENFGKGSLQGIIASEAGNSAVNGANLIPLVTLGIPGTTSAALILGAFMIHGMTPGPFLMRSHPQMLYALFITLIISNFILAGIGSFFIRFARLIYMIPKEILFPTVLLLCTIGAYANARSFFDIYLMVIFGLLSYVLRKYGYPIIPLIIAFVLGEQFERMFRISLLLTGDNYFVFLQKPIALVFFLLSIFIFVMGIKRSKKAKL